MGEPVSIKEDPIHWVFMNFVVLPMICVAIALSYIIAPFIYIFDKIGVKYNFSLLSKEQKEIVNLSKRIEKI